MKKLVSLIFIGIAMSFVMRFGMERTKLGLMEMAERMQTKAQADFKDLTDKGELPSGLKGIEKSDPESARRLKAQMMVINATGGDGFISNKDMEDTRKAVAAINSLWVLSLIVFPIISVCIGFVTGLLNRRGGSGAAISDQPER